MMLSRIFIGLAIGNFVYAAIRGRVYDSAIEHTFFQGAALLLVWLNQLLVDYRKDLKPEEAWVPPKGPFREPKRGDPDFIDTIDG
jgi:hypothetical protein